MSDAGYQGVGVIYRGAGLAGFGIESGCMIGGLSIDGRYPVLLAELDKAGQLAMGIPAQQTALVIVSATLLPPKRRAA